MARVFSAHGKQSSSHMPTYFTYIMASRSGTLYIGVTNDLARRVAEHKSADCPGFTARYGVDRLVYCESFASVYDAIAREKQLKCWKRARKVALIESANSEWADLAADLGFLPAASPRHST
jgi:putative endonuclease